MHRTIQKKCSVFQIVTGLTTSIPNQGKYGWALVDEAVPASMAQKQ